ncbi:MAG TPA: alpha-glucosidase [Chitinophagales bacterium]|nr:alpha-glucosidase [Chitinophagales bacterium]
MLSQELPWWKKTVIYHIYPRSFQDSNHDGIGDIKGIIQRLDYLQELGVETIWFSPFFQSPQQDFGYDISNYRTIAPEYGTLEDVDQLIAQIHQRGMKIMLDMVMNHTSDQHEWFKESCQSKDNPKSDWYMWRDGKGNRPPNNWKSIVWGKGWHYHPKRKQWYYSSFLPFQPDLNYRNPEVQQEMFDTVRYWLDKGIDGFRLDIFNCILKDEQWRDNPWTPNPIPSVEWPGGNFQIRKYSLNQDDNFEFAQKLRNVVDEYGPNNRFLLGEVFGDKSTVRKYLGNQDGLHLIFLFETMYFKFKAKWFKNTIQELENEFPAPLIPTWVLGNHDIYRYIRRVQNDLTKAKLIALIQLTVRAVPTIYFGDEIGIINAIIPRNEAKDPMAAVFHWLPDFLLKFSPVSINRDVCRTPMQWDNSQFCGFSDTKPWLSITAESDKRNVTQMKSDPESLLNWYKLIIALRKKHSALHQGKFTMKTSDKNLLHFERSFEQERIAVLVNFSDSVQIVDIKGQLLAASFTQSPEIQSFISMPAHSGALILL